jgi:hypothetical protein
MKKALCIGINYYSLPKNTLNGCIDDVVNTKNMLIDAYGFQDGNIIVLRDDISSSDSYYPSKQNILNNLKKLIANSAQCDEIWLHYSGHGALLTKNSTVPGATTINEVIVPADCLTAGYITDIDLYSIISQSKCKSLLLFDSCNSGSVCDLPYTFEYTNNTTYLKTQINTNILTNPNIYMISACKVNQIAMDGYDGEYREYVGAFSDAFIRCLRQSNHNIDLLTLYRDVCIFLTQNGYAQTPILSCSSGNINYTFMRASTVGTTTKSILPTILNSGFKKLIYH